ncbi:MAG: ROK family protein [Verrucomicrobia bacterium]|nr:ROK family protein [Verrucomicrobiota bacterium]MBI3869342.1 ROK family protein [Verrucomicrobiota bacterium]
MKAGHSLLLQAPLIQAPLPLQFCPVALGNRAYEAAVANSPARAAFSLALERNQGLTHVFSTEVFTSDHSEDTDRYLNRLVKYLLWQIGGWKLSVAGPARLTSRIQADFSAHGCQSFDARLMQQAYGKPFTVEIVPADALPAAKESSSSIGGHMDGCRIGFDLGASDYKLSAVQDGRAVFTTEIPWDPRTQPNPEWHFARIQEGLRLAATHLPRVDAIGGSSAGIILDNEVRVASLFRSVPEALFQQKARTIFRRIREAWNVPFEVANDGDVTALAGGMSLGVDAILGIAMGSSLAAGWRDGQGRILGWLNELAFVPIDYSPDGPLDEWSGDRGCGVQFFSQQAVVRLAGVAGISLPPAHPAEQLKHVQELHAQGDDRAAKVFQSIGVYYGYAVAQFAAHYPGLRHVLTLGRVTSGAGGDVILEKAREVLGAEFPDINQRVALHLPDEKSKRHGQAVAAASLPSLVRCE